MRILLSQWEQQWGGRVSEAEVWVVLGASLLFTIGMAWMLFELV